MKLWRVLINLENQYSIRPTFKAIPSGWRDEGKRGIKEECLNRIKEVYRYEAKELVEKKAQKQPSSVLCYQLLKTLITTYTHHE